ncbi:hypothetical protein IWQ49_006668 [Labrenzia sp. EL_126]|nr:hypothetical protein [Labrenzia sp. EL_126]
MQDDNEKRLERERALKEATRGPDDRRHYEALRKAREEAHKGVTLRTEYLRLQKQRWRDIGEL